MIHMYTYVCIWAKTGEYSAVFLAFVDLQILFVGQIKPTPVTFICPTNRIYKSTNKKWSFFNVYLSSSQKKSLFFTTNKLKMVCEGKKDCHRLKFLCLLVIC